MIDSKPCFRAVFVGSKRDDPCWFTFSVTCSILFETEVRCPIFISHKLTVVPGGKRFIAKNVAKFWEMFDQVFKFFGIVSIPWCSGEPVDYACVDIDADVEFDAVFSATVSFDSDVVPGATVMGAESGAVNSDIHLFSLEEPGGPVHHLAYVGYGESFHSSLDHAMSREHRVVLFEGFTVFDVCFNTVVGLVESYFKNTDCCDGFWVVSFSSFFVGFPWWWQLVYCFDYRFGEIGGEVAVYMVRNFWINSFLCASHPAKNKGFTT